MKLDSIGCHISYIFRGAGVPIRASTRSQCYYWFMGCGSSPSLYVSIVRLALMMPIWQLRHEANRVMRKGRVVIESTQSVMSVSWRVRRKKTKSLCVPVNPVGIGSLPPQQIIGYYTERVCAELVLSPLSRFRSSFTFTSLSLAVRGVSAIPASSISSPPTAFAT